MLFISCLIATALQGPVASSAIPSSLLKGEPPASNVVASVNGTQIHAGDIEPLLWQIYHGPVVEDFIDFLTVTDAAKALHLSVTDQEVQTSVDQFLASFKSSLGPGQTMEQALAQKGFSDARLYLHARTELLLHKVQLHDFHASDWVKVSTLVFATPGNSAQIVQDAAKKAQDAYARLEKGTPWSTVLREQVTDARILQSNGAIGWHPLRIFPPSVRAELVKLKPGQYTSPAQTANGIQIFKLDLSGVSATGQDLSDLQSVYLQNSERETWREIQARTKVVRY